jgi:integrase
MGRQHIRDVMVDGVPTPMIHLRQRKTGAEMDIPVMPELAAAIDANHSSHLTFLTDNGEPFNDGKFGRWFRSACDAAGLQGFSAHGLRKAGCTTLADHGCTTHEIQAWSGHKSLSEIERYVAKANQVKLVMSGAAKLATSSVKQPPPKLSNRRQQIEKKGK